MTPARVLVADCPWRFDQNKSSESRKFHGTTGDHYPTMSVAELCAFPLPPLLPDCLMFFWRVAAMQQEALDVVRAWGFTVKSELVWLKRTTEGKRHFGMGRYVRAEHEVALICTRGKVSSLIQDHSIRSTFEASVGRHSKKPDEFFDIVESLCPGPYVELFAREPRWGWTVYGNEIPTGVAHA